MVTSIPTGKTNITPEPIARRGQSGGAIGGRTISVDHSKSGSATIRQASDAGVSREVPLSSRSIVVPEPQSNTAIVERGLMRSIYEKLDIAAVLPRRENDDAAYKSAEALVDSVNQQLESYLLEGGSGISDKKRKKIQKNIAHMKQLVATKGNFQRAMLTVASLVPFAPAMYTAARVVPSDGALYATTQAAHYIKTAIQVGVLAADKKAGVPEYAESFKYRQLVSLTFSLAFLKAAMTDEPTDRQPDSILGGAVGVGVFAMSMLVFNPSIVTKMLEKANNFFGSNHQSQIYPKTSAQSHHEVSRVQNDTLGQEAGGSEPLSNMTQLAEYQIDAAIETFDGLANDPQKPLGNVANQKMISVRTVLSGIKEALGDLNEGKPTGDEMAVSKGAPVRNDRSTKVALATVGAIVSSTVALANAASGNLSGFVDFALDGVLAVGELFKKALDSNVNLQGQKALFTDLEGLALLLVVPFMVDWMAEEPGDQAGKAFWTVLAVMSVANLTLPGPAGEAVGSLIQLSLIHI